MTPYEAVREKYKFPFDLRPYQVERINALAEFDRAGYYWKPGLGKTSASTTHALYWKDKGVPQWIVLMPPILLRQWENWLRSVQPTDGSKLRVSVYYGTPAQRKKVDLSADFILTTYGMLKNDFEYLSGYFEHRVVGTIPDEATAMKNIASQTNRAIHEFSSGRPLLMLTGTPITKPGDAYAYIREIAPKVYRNSRHFNKLHVAEEDEWGGPVEWQNLDLLAENMRIGTSSLDRREVASDLPPVLYTPIPYDLDPEHAKLYRQIAEERLVELDTGGEINAMSANSLRYALQQVIVNWAYFADKEGLRPSVLDLIDETFEEIGEGKKLVVVAHFRLSNAYLVKHLSQYGAHAIYGDVTKAARYKAIDAFTNDPKCRCIILQPSAAGFGVDGLQQVCSDMLVLEAPTTAPPFHQVVARLDRDGQKEPVNCRIAIAQKTVQVGLFRSLLDNDAVINAVQGSLQDLRESIYGA